MESQVSEILQTDVLICPPDRNLVEAARLMRQRNCSSIIVVDDDYPVGIWTEHDATRLDFSDPNTFNAPIAEVMSSPLKSLPLDISIDEAAMRFREEGVRHFVAIDASGRLAGVISQTDVTLGHSIDHYLTLRPVTTAMRDGFLRLPADLPLHDAVRRMNQKRCDAAVVDYADGERGIITERDLVRLVAECHHDGVVGEHASVPLLTVPASGTLLAARNLLEGEGIRHLGVTTDEEGELNGVLGISDILQILQHDYLQSLAETLRERGEQLLRSRRDLQLAERVIDSAHNALAIADTSGRVEFVNPAFCRLTGLDGETVKGQMLAEFVVDEPQQQATVRQSIESLDVGGYWAGELERHDEEGGVRHLWVSMELSECSEGEERQLIANLSDITERRQLEERTRYLAYYDALTGLPNRTLFLDRLQTSLHNDQRHGHFGALLFMDLDNFKNLNDVRGHECGDQLLKQVATRLSGQLREEDTVARFGGDEFVVLLPELAECPEGALQGALNLAEKLRNSVSEPYCLGDFEHQVGISIGITAFPKGNETVEDLLKEADTAMYRAKEAGRNTVRCFESTMQAELEAHLALEQKLRHALAEDQLAIYLQPQYSEEGEAVGAEALLRWEHPEHGLMTPDKFIHLAEESGLIVSMGDWVLCEVCRILAKLEAIGQPQSVSVNISLRQFRQPDFVERVLAIVEEHGALPERLVLEVTEVVVLDDLADTIDKMQRLRLHGIRFSLDDFGTGHSSLACLDQLPLNELKIDRGFIHKMAVDDADSGLVGTILAVAQHLSLRVVAEGVETGEQRDYLNDQQCSIYQGHYFDRPMPAREYLERQAVSA